jgi:hypothetical protein
MQSGALKLIARCNSAPSAIQRQHIELRGPSRAPPTAVRALAYAPRRPRETLLLRDFDRWPLALQDGALDAMRGSRPRAILTTTEAHHVSGVDARSMRVPPLREREPDNGPLAQHSLTHYALNAVVSPDAEAALVRHAWPGNVAELRNSIERVALTGIIAVDYGLP